MQSHSDGQGNLIVICGIPEWPEPFTELSDEAHAVFPFFGDIQVVGNPASKLVVLDLGMCAAGIDSKGFGKGEFSVCESSTEALPTDPVLGGGVLVRDPAVRPGFGFPSPAECQSGYLPLMWSAGQAPQVARYLPASRATAGADTKRHVYQWELGVVAVKNARPEADRAVMKMSRSVLARW